MPSFVQCNGCKTVFSPEYVWSNDCPNCGEIHQFTTRIMQTTLDFSVTEEEAMPKELEHPNPEFRFTEEEIREFWKNCGGKTYTPSDGRYAGQTLRVIRPTHNGSGRLVTVEVIAPDRNSWVCIAAGVMVAMGL